MSRYDEYGKRRPVKVGTTRGNAYAGTCHYCGAEVPAHGGLAVRTAQGWVVEHRPMVWAGSPVSGQYAGGCPGQAEAKNTEGGFGSQVRGQA